MRGVISPTVRTAVIGASGYVGRFLWRSYRSEFPDSVGTTFSRADRELVAFDIRKPELGQLQLEKTGCQAVLIASAKPNIDFCRQHREEALSVNVTGTLDLIHQVAATSMQVIFISSDYIFEGDKGAYSESDPPNPTTDYGLQKLLVERAIPEITDNYLILRLSKIFGLVRGDGTLLDDIACSLARGKRMRLARDQFFSPTYVGDVVNAVNLIQKCGYRGTINLCSPEPTSRYQIGLAMAGGIGAETGLVEPVALHEIPAMRGRPLNTSMVCSKLITETPFQFTPLRECIETVASHYTS